MTDPTLKPDPFWPSLEAVSTHFSYSRRRSIRRHNQQVVDDARRRQKINRVKKILRRPA